MTRMKQFHRKREMLSTESKEAAGYCAFLSEQVLTPDASRDYQDGFNAAIKEYRRLICQAFDIDYKEAVVMPSVHHENEQENQQVS